MTEIIVQGETSQTEYDVSEFKWITVIVYANGGDVGLEHSSDGSNWAESDELTGTGVIVFEGCMQLIRITPSSTGTWDIIADN